MEERNYYMDRGIGNSGVAEIERFNSLSEMNRDQDPTFLLEEGRVRPNSGTFFGTTSSRLDKRLPSVEQMMAEGLTADQARAEEQTALNRIGNALVNNAVIAGTTAIGGTIGTIYGAFDAIANQELSRLWDNPVNRKMLEWQEAAAQALPNHYKKGYEESSIWKKLGTSMFWADLIKNLGYTEGMMIPGMGVSAALSRVPRVVQAMGSAISGAVSEASIEALQAKEDKKALEEAKIAEEYNKALRLAASPEEMAAIKEEYSNTINDIEEDANQAGNYVFGYNMALLTATNAIEWGKLFTRGNKASRAALKAKERSAGIKVAEDGLFLNIEQPWLNTAKNLGRRGYQAFTEGTEEILQDVAVRAADLNPEYNSFNESIFNPEKRELADNSLQALGMAFSQAMKDPETATNFAMGFFTSVLGSPRFRAPREDGQWRSPVTMEGGITEFMRERRDYNRRRAVVNDINTRMADPKFQEYYNGLVRDMDLTEKANQALEAGDEFNFQNYQFASMVSDVIMLDNVGQGKMLDDIIDRASNMSDEEVQGLIDSGLFQQNGNPMSVADAKLKIQENASKMKSLSQQYREMKEFLEASKNGSEFSKDALENLIYAKMQIENWRERQKQITDEVVNLYKSSLSPLMNEEDILSDLEVRLVSTLPQTRKELKNLIEESEFTDDVKEEWKNKIDDLDKIQNNITKFREKVNSYYNSPQKANKEQDKIKEKAIKKESDKKKSEAKTRLAEAVSPRDLRRIYRTIESEGKVASTELDRALNELEEEEGNTVVKENRNIQSLYQGAVAKLSDMGLPQNEVSDAIIMLRNAMDNASTVSELAEPTNPVYTEASKFYNEENPASTDTNANAKRFLTAQAAAYKALSAHLVEMGKNNEAAKFTIGNNPNPPKGPVSASATGDSGVSPAPAANKAQSSPYSTSEIISSEGEPGIAAGSFEENYGKEGLSDYPDTEKSQREQIGTEESVDPNRSWFPLSWFFIGAKKRNGTLIPISNTEAIQQIDKSIDFGGIPSWLESKGAQEYVDSGKLKVGDKVVLGIPFDLVDIKGNPVIVYYKIDGENRIPVGVFSTSGDLAKNVRNKILKEYEKADKSKTFYSSVTTTVNDIKFGYIQYGESRTLDSSEDVTLAVVKNGALVTGESKVKARDIHRPTNISEKNGMVYIAVPNARRGMTNGYSLVGVKVKRFNKTEFPVENWNDSPITQRIMNSLINLMSVKTQKELSDAVKDLSSYLYIPHLNFYLTKDGKIRITENILNNKGELIKKTVKRADGTSTIENKESSLGVFSKPEDIFTLLYNRGPRFQVDSRKINNAEYNKMLLDSGVLSINATELKSTGGWFTVNPVNESGEIKGTKIPFRNTPPKNTPQSSDNSLIVTISGRQMTLFPGGEYISLADGQRKTPKNPDTAERYKILYNLQKEYGESTNGATMWNNKAVVGDRVIDRNTGEWITGAAADEVRSHVNPEPVLNTLTSQSVDSLFQNHDNMNPVEDLSENSKLPEGKIGYYFDSRDKRIHKTYMTSGGEILGTSVQVIKIPVMTSGLNSKGPKKLAGYNYGIVLPNGQSYISTKLNNEAPIDAVFRGIKKSFEGPGSGPKGQEFVEKHKKEFNELRSMPSVFPEQIITDPAEEVMSSITEENSSTNTEMSFEAFAAAMGADFMGDEETKLRETSDEFEVWNREKELKWLEKILPNISVEVREGILHIAGKNAWGMFDRAGITLSNIAASGTAYHEAFHAVFSLGLIGTERVDLVREAMKESGLTDPVEVEEWLAERFREYVMNQQTKTVGQKIKDFFKKLWNLIRGIREAGPMRYSIYRRIVSGSYRNIRPEPQAEVVAAFRPVEKAEDNSIFLENGYSEEWVRNSTPDEKRIARYCIGI